MTGTTTSTATNPYPEAARSGRTSFLSLPLSLDHRDDPASSISPVITQGRGSFSLLHDRDNPLHGFLVGLSLLCTLILVLLSVPSPDLLLPAVLLGVGSFALIRFMWCGFWNKAHRSGWRRRQAVAVERALMKVIARHPEAASSLIFSRNRSIIVRDPRRHLDGRITATVSVFGFESRVVLMESGENDRKAWLGLNRSAITSYHIRQTSAHEAIRFRREALERYGAANRNRT